MHLGFEPVANGEVLLRRVHPQWIKDDGPSPKAFRPTKGDTDGLSFYRDKYVTREEAARMGTSQGKCYHVARLRVESVRALGLTLQPDGPGGIKGHCIIPELHSGNADSEAAKEFMVRLVDCVIRIDGPYLT